MDDLETRLNALRSTTEALFGRLARYDEATLNATPRPDAWSALQICHHLMLAEAGTLRYFRKKLSHNPALQPTDWKEKLRVWVLRTYLGLGLKKQAPPYLRGEHLPTTTTLATTTERWRTQRAELRDYLLSLPAELHGKQIFKHPFAGRLSLAGTVAFLEAHQARHIKQIERTLAEVSTPNVPA